MQCVHPFSVGFVRSKRQSIIMNATAAVSVEELKGLCLSSLQTLGYTRDEASILTEVRTPCLRHTQAGREVAAYYVVFMVALSSVHGCNGTNVEDMVALECLQHGPVIHYSQV